MIATAVLPPLSAQVERLAHLRVVDLAGPSGEVLRNLAASHPLGSGNDALLVVHPDHVAPSRLAPLLEREGKRGFVVEDMTDVDRFAPITGITLPSSPCYLVRGLERGDEMGNWSPEEALPAITKAGRTPLTLSEGICWVLQQPGALERNRCFMTVGSRLRRPAGTLDARTPAVWLSNGTGRDGRANRNAPKVGWCWARNRHTWLGFASARERVALPLG